METSIPQVDEIAKLIDVISKTSLFTCLSDEILEYKKSVEYKMNAVTTGAFFNRLSIYLKSNRNTIEKKEFVKTVIDFTNKEYANFWNLAKALYAARTIYLPVEHMNNNIKIIKDFANLPKAKEQFLSAADFVTKTMAKDYNTLNDAAKLSAEKLYWDALFEDSINEKGLIRLEEEKTRYRAALVLIPNEFINKYPHIPIQSNPLDYLLIILKMFSDSMTITNVN